MESYYIFYYYTIVIIALLSAPLLWKSNYLDKSNKLLKPFIILFTVAIYLFGMARQYGVDYTTYLFAYDIDSSVIPDLGYRLLTYLFNLVKLPFQAFVLSIGILNLVVFRRLASFYNVSFIALFALYLVHLAIVRDFSQIRICLAISIIYLSITFPNKPLRFSLYLLAFSIHSTSIFFSVSFEFFKFFVDKIKVRKRRFYVLTVFLIIILLSAFLISSKNYLGNLYFLDDRIETYTNWDQESYGREVTNFSILIFHILLLITALFKRVWRLGSDIEIIFYLQILGVIVFLAFREYAIFAYRLSSVTLSLYPVLVLSLMKGKFLGEKYISLLIYVLIAYVLLTRPESIDILSNVSW